MSRTYLPLKLALFSIFVLSNQTVFGAEQVAAIIDTSCALGVGDAFEGPVRLTEASAKFANDCIDSDRFRAAKVVENSPTRLVFGNYLHDGKYWIATMSKAAKIDAVYFHVVKFDVVEGVTAAHTQIRVRFKKGSELKLKSQNGGSEIGTSNDFVISFEASRPKNEPYNFALGAFSNYAAVARVLSGKQRLAEADETNKTEQYMIDLPEAEARMLVERGVIQSEEQGFSRMYNTLKPNCTTDAFDLIDGLPSVAKKNPIPFLTVLSNDPIAGPSVEALKDRGILIGQLPNLREEIVNGDLSAPKPVLDSKQSANGFLASVEGWPFSLVLIPSDGLGELKDEAIRMAYDIVPGLIQSLGSAAISDPSEAAKVLVSVLQEISFDLQPKLEKLNAKLPRDAEYLRLFFVP
ncbi:MAG: DUF4105 domain-containing protein, partial [Bdellovibrionales bacterium]|nr:DUF4105 domain-containing protein [Bdellovibrionales bacterium]